MSLEDFHHLNRDGKPTGANDYAIFQHLTQTENIIFLGRTPYIYKNGLYVPDYGGTKLKSKIRECILPAFIRSTTIKRIFDLFTLADELQVQPEELNQYPARWINFQNGFYDPIAREIVPHAPSYKAVNQIPHEFLPYIKLTGSHIDEWLSFICPNADDKEMLLEFFGYCMTRDTAFQKFLILCGLGGTGKSTLIRLLETVIGENNISNVSLKELSQRFASYDLMGKLLNSCADLELGALDDVSVIKKLLGEDSIRAEQKGEPAIRFRNYSKLVFSTNELPLVVGERTNGFYRRLLILKMDRLPQQVKPHFLDDLLAEIDYFILLCVKALERAYSNGMICESAESVQAVKQLRKDSDTVEAWLHEDVSEDPSARLETVFAFNRYCAYCDRMERTPLKKQSFTRSLISKGHTKYKTMGAWYFKGISAEKTSLENSSEGINIVDDPTLPY